MMNWVAEQHRIKLAQKYEFWQARSVKGTFSERALARDEMRKLAKVFEKTFHQSIDRYIKS